MDLVLHYADEFLLDGVWARIAPAAKFPSLCAAAEARVLNGTAPSTLFPTTCAKPGEIVSALPRDNIIRQTLSLYVITYIGIVALYFACAIGSYHFLFNKDLMRHPRFLKNQIRLEIELSLRAFPWLDLLTVPWFVLEVRGYSRMYENVSDYGWLYLFFTIPFFLVFTDSLIYWIHRLEHHPAIYKYIHKPHHKWIVPTPFASHAFHPLDGYAQSLPYHLFPVIFPMQKLLFLGMFGFVNLWSIMIHDSDMVCNTGWERIINGPAHHTLHHLYFTCNYGQYFTICDRLFASFREPAEKDDPLVEATRIKSD